MEYPYQVVAFLDDQPEKGQLIYGNESGGWLPQIALKRRFTLKEDINEPAFIERMRDYIATIPEFEIQTGELEKPEHMPVEIISIPEPSDATKFHHQFLEQFGEAIVSKYPDRENDNYFPHITAQYWDKYVIDVEEYQDKTFTIRSVWLVKDAPNEKDTAAFEQFLLRTN
jgi:hypothetical protein